MLRLQVIGAVLCALSASASAAGICDYRPTQLIGNKAVAVVGGGAAGLAVTGTAAKAAGVYTLVHATSGATMIGGTWAGTSAAGTAGIIGGTAGVAGTVTAVATAPITITVAAVTTVALSGYEGSCYFTDDRITDENTIDDLVRDIALTAPETDFEYLAEQDETGSAAIRVRDASDPENVHTYAVKNLYIVNGVLKHRDWGFNTTIGIVASIASQNSVE